jgi:hypothetical protein
VASPARLMARIATAARRFSGGPSIALEAALHTAPDVKLLQKNCRSCGISRFRGEGEQHAVGQRAERRRSQQENKYQC